MLLKVNKVPFTASLALLLLLVGSAAGLGPSAIAQNSDPASPAKTDEKSGQSAEAVYPPLRITPGESIRLETLSLLPADSEPWEFPKDDGDALYRWIMEKNGEMPGDIRDVPNKGDALTQVQILVDNQLLAAWHHRKNFPSHAKAADVLAVICDLTCLNEARFLFAEGARNKAEFGVDLTADELLELAQRYYRPVCALAVEGLTLSPSKKGQARFLNTLGVCHLSLGGRNLGAQFFSRARELQIAAADYFALALEFDPEQAKAVDNSIKLIDTLLQARENRRAGVEAERFMQRWPKSRYWPHVFYFLNKALRRDGRCAEAIALWKKYKPVLEAGEKMQPMPEWHIPGGWTAPPSDAQTYALYAERTSFYIGFYQFALGLAEKAAANLGAFMVEANEREAAGKLQMPGKVYRDAMAYFLVETIQNLVAKPAPPVELGDGWIVAPDEDARLTLLLFCDNSRALGRHRELFKVLTKIGQERWSKGVRVQWVNAGSRRKDDTPESQKGEMSFVARQVGAIGAYGVDLPAELPVWNAYAIHRGSVHLFVLDENRHVEWQLIDPMAWDSGLIEKVVERVLGEAEE